MANYVSKHTGQQVDSAITKVLELVNTSSEINEAVGKALTLDDIELVADEVIDSLVYHTLWKKTPTATNKVYGFALHPTTGKLVHVISSNNVKTAVYVVTTEDTILNSEIDALFN